MRNPFLNPLLPSAEGQDPIAEKKETVSYLGVKLEKATKSDPAFVPKKEQYRDFINDEQIALPLQRDLAIAFLSGEPILVEGGTSLGKTTTVRKMAADLGWEVHYANLNGTTEVEDLMGRYVPNATRKNASEPEYLFADGKVTSGLRHEEGKTKIIILDEFNAAKPGILIRLHEVLDALERDGEVVLSEDASEVFSVKKSATKVVALMNSPGKGYFQREPIDPAQLRRWVYKKMPSELPAKTFSHATDALFGLSTTTSKVDLESFTVAREHFLTAAEMQEIPGMQEILLKYKEFHAGAKTILSQRKIAEDQPQLFTFDDRMEPRRVRDFVLRFYKGDLNETFQQALGYYYANKLEKDIDRRKLGELIGLVEYRPAPTDTKRRGLDTVKLVSEREAEANASLVKAREILGKTNVFGPREIERTFGTKIELKDMPTIPFTEAELRAAVTLNQMLVLRTDTAPDKTALTPKKMSSLVEKRWQKEKKGRLLAARNEEEWGNVMDAPRFGWALSMKGNILEDADKMAKPSNLEAVIAVLQESFGVGLVDLPRELFDAYTQAQSGAGKDDLQKMICPSASEVVYDATLLFDKHGKRLYEDHYTTVIDPVTGKTNTHALGYFDKHGIRMRRIPTGSEDKDIGMSYSRSK